VSKRKSTSQRVLAKAINEILWEILGDDENRSAHPDEYDGLATIAAFRGHSGEDAAEVTSWLVAELEGNWGMPQVDSHRIKSALEQLLVH